MFAGHDRRRVPSQRAGSSPVTGPNVADHDAVPCIITLQAIVGALPRFRPAIKARAWVRRPEVA